MSFCQAGRQVRPCLRQYPAGVGGVTVEQRQFRPGQRKTGLIERAEFSAPHLRQQAAGRLRLLGLKKLLGHIQAQAGALTVVFGLDQQTVEHRQRRVVALAINQSGDFFRSRLCRSVGAQQGFRGASRQQDQRRQGQPAKLSHGRNHKRSACGQGLAPGLTYNARMNEQAGVERATLWVVATPIGNLGDQSLRMQELLRRVPVIAAEDTRVTRRLLGGRQSEPRWLSLNEHTEGRALPALIQILQSGQDVALVSDAGTPLVSDPGYRLVDAAHAAGIRVSPLPGPCAAIAALSAAGLAADRFWFEGFLPSRRAARIARLRELKDLPSTLIAYVPARDLVAVLEDALAVLGPVRPAALARELTKLHETVCRRPVARLLEFCQARPEQSKGEAVLLLGGSETPPVHIDAEALADELAAALPPSRAAGILSRLSGLSRKQAWAVIEQRRGSRGEGETLTDEP